MINDAGYEKLKISIHALRKESDLGTILVGSDPGSFQSTLSVRRATPRTVQPHHGHRISIHALRKESDCHCPKD